MLFLSTLPTNFSVQVLSKWTSTVGLINLNSSCCNKVDRECFNNLLYCGRGTFLLTDAAAKLESLYQKGTLPYNLQWKEILKDMPLLSKMMFERKIYIPDSENIECMLQLKRNVAEVVCKIDNELNLTEAESNHNLKNQQDRLLLLRHTSKCLNGKGQCRVTSSCWGMKVLWSHLLVCRDMVCQVPHCLSSRFILAHYAKCEDSGCRVCQPVREAVKRNFMKYNHYPAMLLALNPNRSWAQPAAPGKHSVVDGGETPVAQCLGVLAMTLETGFDGESNLALSGQVEVEVEVKLKAFQSRAEQYVALVSIVMGVSQSQLVKLDALLSNKELPRTALLTEVFFWRYEIKKSTDRNKLFAIYESVFKGNSGYDKLLFDSTLSMSTMVDHLHSHVFHLDTGNTDWYNIL